MSTTPKKVLKKSLRGTKKAIVAVPVLRKVAIRAKAAIVARIGSTGPREIYNYHLYYPTVADYVRQKNSVSQLKKRPLISIVMPTYNTPEAYLRECIESVMLQSYDNWELCVADDASPDPNVVRIVEEYVKQDERIHMQVRPQNGHISEATNTAISMAHGEYIALLDHDDILWPNTLFEIVSSINEHPEADLIYTDEDKIGDDSSMHSYPFLKPDWSPEFLESCNFITHFSTIKASTLAAVGGPRKGYEGAQDWDLFVRLTEHTSAIVHIPKILYSWRIHEASTAANTDAKPYVYEAQLKLLNDHLTRTRRQGLVETGIIRQHRTIKYAVDPAATLTAFITINSYGATKRLFQSMVRHAGSKRFEIVYITAKPEAAKLQAIMAGASGVSQTAINISSNDWGAIEAHAKGEFIALLDDGVEIVSDDWVEIAMGDAQLTDVGLVGPVLLGPDKETVESAGVGVGYGQHYADMLQGVPFDDPHYTRGLYAKSRRNVSALHPSIIFCSKAVLAVVAKESHPPKDRIELALELLAKGRRHIYTPYIKTIYHGTPYDYSELSVVKTEDRYLNPHFNHSNGNMEVVG